MFLALGVASAAFSTEEEPGTATPLNCADQAAIYIKNMNKPSTIDGCQIALSHCMAMCTEQNCDGDKLVQAACRLSCNGAFGAGHCP